MNKAQFLIELKGKLCSLPDNDIQSTLEIVLFILGLPTWLSLLVATMRLDL